MMKFLYFVNALIITSPVYAYFDSFESEPNYTQTFYTAQIITPLEPIEPTPAPSPAPKAPTVESVDSLINIQWPEFRSRYNGEKRFELMADFVFRAHRTNPTLATFSVSWATEPSGDLYVKFMKEVIPTLSSKQRELLFGISLYFQKEESLASYDFIVLTVSKWLTPNVRS